MILLIKNTKFLFCFQLKKHLIPCMSYVAEYVSSNKPVTGFTGNVADKDLQLGMERPALPFRSSCSISILFGPRFLFRNLWQPQVHSVTVSFVKTR